MHAWYSKKSNALCGTVIWRQSDGNEIVASCISETLAHGYGWDDMVYLGEVEEYVRRGSPACKNEIEETIEETNDLHFVEREYL